MESAVSIPFRHGFVTHLSLLPQQWSDSSQELSAKLQSIAETGKLAVVYKEHYDPNTPFPRHPAGGRRCDAVLRRIRCNLSAFLGISGFLG